MLAGFFDQPGHVRFGDHRAGRITGRADVDQFATLPGVIADRVEVRQVVVFRPGAVEVRRRAGKQRGALVDLVERVRHQHQRIAVVIDRALREGEQRLAGAVDRDHVLVREDRTIGQVEATLKPVADGQTQLRIATGRRVLVQLRQVIADCVERDPRRRVFRLADRQRDVRKLVWRCATRLECGEFFERVGL